MIKPIWTSKTFWFNMLLKLSGVASLFVPSIQTFLANHPSALLIIIGFIGNILRLVTSGKVVLTNDLPATKP